MGAVGAILSGEPGQWQAACLENMDIDTVPRAQRRTDTRRGLLPVGGGRGEGPRGPQRVLSVPLEDGEDRDTGSQENLL